MKDRRKHSDELRPEYAFDYSKAIRGKHYRTLLTEGANVVVLDPDIAKAFPDSGAVNKTLRSLLELAHATKHVTSSQGKSTRKTRIR